MKHLSVLIVVLLFADDVKFPILFCLTFTIFKTPKLLTSLEVLILFIQNGMGNGALGMGHWVVNKLNFHLWKLNFEPKPSNFNFLCPMTND
jgi:hypothetical protein